MSQIKIAPSILAGNFGFLADSAKAVREADVLHVDVMDGHFVPNITIGPQAVGSIKESSSLPLDVHLMISDPLKYAPEFAKNGANNITFHVEAVTNPRQVIQKIKSLGVRCGIALKPKTSFEAVKEFMNDIDLLLIMTVEPGFGGQKFMADMLPKIEKAKSFILKNNIDIEVDGGIDLDTASLVVQAGANVLVAGSAIYGKPDISKAIQDLRNSAGLNASGK